jgi:hypothetical protein
MSTNTTDNVTLRKSISLVVNSSLFRKIVNGVVTTEYQKMAENINQKVEEILLQISRLSVTVPLDSITQEHLQTDSVITDKLADGTVTTDKIAPSAITSEKIAINSILSSHLTSGSVTLPALASDITNILDSSSSDLIQIINKITNIENYLIALSSTYTIKDESNNTIEFNPNGIMAMASTAIVPLPSPEPAPCPPN